MSDAQLLAGFEACARRLAEERNRHDYVPLHVAICHPEGPGASILQEDGLFVPLLNHADYTPRVTVSTYPPDAFAVAFYISRDCGFIPTERVNGLIRRVEGVVGEIQNLCRQLPTRVREALRLPEGRDWWRTMYHLAWHFDRPFLASHRVRLLAWQGEGAMHTDETCIQQYGIGDRGDVLPGLIFGTLKHDALTASEAAVGVLIDAIRGSAPLPGTASGEVGRVFARLRAQFLQAAEGEESLPGGMDTTVKLLRFSDSFTTPPATEWAAVESGGCLEKWWRLARINADQEFCQVRGPATRYYETLATEAGNALPAGVPDCPALFDDQRTFPNGFVARIAGPTPILSPGPAERWLRFVFSTLKHCRPEELQIRWGTEAGPTSYGMATLKRNFCAASALAIELAGLAPAASLADLEAASQQDFHNGMATLDTIGVGPGQVVQVTGLSCKVVPGSTPTPCPDASPPLPPPFLGAAERAIRRVNKLPPGTTIHWVGHEGGARSSCLCPEYRDAPFAAPFDQERWVCVAPCPAPAADNPEVVPVVPVNHLVSVPDAPSPAADLPPLDSAETAILQKLGRAHPKLLKNVEIEVATSLSKQTVGRAVVALIDRELATRPKGERKGTTLTPEGLAVLDRLRNSSTDHP